MDSASSLNAGGSANAAIMAASWSARAGAKRVEDGSESTDGNRCIGGILGWEVGEHAGEDWRSMFPMRCSSSSSEDAAACTEGRVAEAIRRGGGGAQDGSGSSGSAL